MRTKQQANADSKSKAKARNQKLQSNANANANIFFHKSKSKLKAKSKAKIRAKSKAKVKPKQSQKQSQKNLKQKQCNLKQHSLDPLPFAHIYSICIYTHTTLATLSMYVYICMYVCVLVCAWPSSELCVTCVTPVWTCRWCLTELSCSRSRWTKHNKTNSNNKQEQHIQSINQLINCESYHDQSLRCRRRILGVFPWNFSYSFTKMISIDKTFV